MAIKWTLKSLKEEASKYTTRGGFNFGSKGAYLSAYRKGILDDICSHMEPSKSKPWTVKELHKEALKYKTRYEFQKNNEAYQSAWKRDLLDQICGHMEESRHVWTDQELREEALKYDNRVDFQQKNSGAYQSARNKKILDQICLHMGRSRSKSYSLEELKKEASIYNTRGEFQKGSPAYQAAQGMGLLDQICSHMRKSGNVSIAENNLFDVIKSIYPKTQKLRDMKVKIDEKPFICGFEIDIYVPELRKGIEFDGTYWHSPKRLKKSKPEWSNEDIANYHELKDAWFATKGIELIHIKEEDWNKNKQICIEKCLEFLGNI